MWMVAKALGRDLDSNTIIRACQCDSYGVWPTRLALAFQELGFKVEYRAHSVVAEEPALHAEAKSKNLPILPPMLLRDLLKLPAITIITYDVVEGGPHFTPALPIANDCVYLPLDYDAPIQAIQIVERQRRKADLETITVFR